MVKQIKWDWLGNDVTQEPQTKFFDKYLQYT